MFDTGAVLGNPQFFVGVVEDIIDKRKEGRVKVRAFGVHGTKDQIPTDKLPWAIVVHGDYDVNKRLALNSWVFGVFLDGREAQQPMILGLIPTQMTKPLNPEEDGYGAIPSENCELQMKEKSAKDAGQPQQSRLHRGENIHQTYVYEQELNRIENVVGAEGAEVWDEPPAAYNAEYPFNKVIETAKHRIEIDDTRGAERIMIHHNSGSFIQIDDRGTKTDKTIKDKFEVNDRNQYVYVGGCSNVTIEGNAYVRVNGNKTEEIMGNYTQLIHGNHMISVGIESNINAATAVNVRGQDINIHANAGELSLMAQNNMWLETVDKGIGLKSAFDIWAYAEKKIQFKSEDFRSTQTEAIEFNSKNLRGTTSEGIDFKTPAFLAEGTNYVDLYAPATARIGGGSSVNIKTDSGGTVYIDDKVNMANGSSTGPLEDPFEANEAETEQETNKPDMPEPVTAGTAKVDKCGEAIFVAGITARDDPGESS